MTIRSTQPLPQDHYFCTPHTIYMEQHIKQHINIDIMKKSFFFAALLAVVCAASAVAQPRAVGVNLGYGVDVSYQHGIGAKNMVDM